MYGIDMHNFKTLISCQRNLDFHPEVPWSDLLPLYCFEDELLCGFHAKDKTHHETHEATVIEFKNHNLPQCLKVLHPYLSFPEISRLAERISVRFPKHTHPESKEWVQQLWRLYGYQPREDLLILATKITALPFAVQQWLTQKKLAPQDLAPLRAVNDLNILNDYWEILLSLNPSKSEGTKGIELLVELILMGHSKETLNTHATTTQSWLSFLQSLRYPLSTQQDLHAESKIRTLHWPAKSEARWVRRGDRSGVELKLFFSNPEELKINLVRLEKISRDVDGNNTLAELWSKN